MNSNDNNIRNPLSSTDLQLFQEINAKKAPKIELVPQIFYDHIQVKDPYTIYVISDAPNRMYYGESLIINDPDRVSYLMSTDVIDGREYYPIFMQMPTPKYLGSNIIEICRYENAIDALNALRKFNAAGGHGEVVQKIYDSIVLYSRDDISMEDFLISCLVAFGFKDDPRLQQIIQVQTSYHRDGDVEGPDLPMALRADIKRMANRSDDAGNSLLKMYSDIYDTMIKYGIHEIRKQACDIKAIIKDITSIVFKHSRI